MLRLGLGICLIAAWACAQSFSFTIGSPVAAPGVMTKMAAFVFRIEGCDPAKAEVSGSAEGLVDGQRRSVALALRPATQPGVWAVNRGWPAQGQWVVNLKGTCGGAAAGAIVPFGPDGFIREASKFLPRPATDAEIETSLKALAPGGNK